MRKYHYQQKLIDLMFFKRNVFPPKSRSLYFNNDNAIDIMYWSDRRSKEVFTNIKYFLEDSKAKLALVSFSRCICPFCLYYKLCAKCSYGKRHGRCPDYDSTFNSLFADCEKLLNPTVLLKILGD